MKKRFGDISYSAEDVLLVLNSYEDIFSDFDPRPYTQKSMSGDFINECRKASEDKEQVHLRLIVPKKLRNIKEETIIKRRLKEHFKRHTKIKKKKIFDIQKSGFFWFVLGCVMMIICAFSLDYKGNVWFNIILTIASPAGWFFMWEGLGKILIKAKEHKSDYLFNKKFTDAEIIFESR